MLAVQCSGSYSSALLVSFIHVLVLMPGECKKGITLSATAGEIVRGKGGHTLCIPDCGDPINEV